MPISNISRAYRQTDIVILLIFLLKGFECKTRQIQLHVSYVKQNLPPRKLGRNRQFQSMLLKCSIKLEHIKIKFSTLATSTLCQHLCTLFFTTCTHKVSKVFGINRPRLELLKQLWSCFINVNNGVTAVVILRKKNVI